MKCLFVTRRGPRGAEDAGAHELRPKAMEARKERPRTPQDLDPDHPVRAFVVSMFHVDLSRDVVRDVHDSKGTRGCPDSRA